MPKGEEIHRWDLHRLKEEYESNQGLEKLVSEFYNQSDSAKNVVDNMNALIGEYNKLIASDNTYSISMEYKRYLFKMMDIVLPFMDT